MPGAPPLVLPATRTRKGSTFLLIGLPLLVTPNPWLKKAKNWLAQALPQ
jgi:hypothetical protein